MPSGRPHLRPEASPILFNLTPTLFVAAQFQSQSQSNLSFYLKDNLSLKNDLPRDAFAIRLRMTGFNNIGLAYQIRESLNCLRHFQAARAADSQTVATNDIRFPPICCLGKPNRGNYAVVK
ncbi:MAG: hypothetical protein GY904_11440 [Planctomycetaceae bacterium]|nr:hypothetical protein [Planctomycetaceae bacterium]